MPVFLLLVLLFLAWFTYERRKTGKADKKRSEAFWDRERTASYAPRRDTGDIRFIAFPKELIPKLPENASDELKGYVEKLEALAETRLADLSDISNTELKLRYGASNFDSLSNADLNYSEFTAALSGAACEFAKAGLKDSAESLIGFAGENGIMTGDIICAKAVLLAENDDIKGIESLIETAGTHPAFSSCSDYIVGRLRDILNNMLKQ